MLKMLSILLISVPLVALAQTCRTEAEIPSSTPTSDFTDQGDGTIIHNKTGLMWMKCPLGQSGVDCATGSANSYTWQEALVAASNSTYGGYSDWRLPNIKELRSIVESRCYAPAINISVFTLASSWHFWSSTPAFSYDSDSAWYVYFFTGFASDTAGDGNPRNSNYRVRLVRSGQ